MPLFNNTSTIIVQNPYPFRPVQFSILLLISICSIPCFIFVLYHFLSTRTLYRALNNHVIILLLMSNCIQTLTDVPMKLSYYFSGVIWPRTVNYCYLYYFIDFYLFTTCFLLLTWASFERHILIFHTQFFNTYRKRVIGHYVPLGFCIIYPLIYYIVFIFFYPCESYYDFDTSSCFVACYLWTSRVMALYEQIAHGFALMFLIFIFNLILFLRVLHQKNRMGREMTWTKNRKMAVQLFSVCLLFLVSNGGYFVIELGETFSDPNFGRHYVGWFYPISMCMPPLIPFMCLSTLQDLRVKVRRLIPSRTRTIVAPITASAPQRIPRTISRRQDA